MSKLHQDSKMISLDYLGLKLYKSNIQYFTIVDQNNNYLCMDSSSGEFFFVNDCFSEMFKNSGVYGKDRNDVMGIIHDFQNDLPNHKLNLAYIYIKPFVLWENGQVY